MPLDYHLDYRVAFSDDAEFKNLYKWCIQEWDGEKKIGRDLIPWDWTLNFTATTVEYRHQYARGERYQWAGPNGGDCANDEDKPPPFTEREHIRVELRPGWHDDDPRWRTSYSMMGTNREIKTITLLIYPPDKEGDFEKAVVTAGLSFTTEVDFRNETAADYLQFYATFSRERFNELKARIKANDFDIATMTVNRVDGFYSDWSPSISTSDIKVLSKPKEHKLELPEDLAVHVPTIGKLDELDFSLLTRRKMTAPIFSPEEAEENDISYEQAIDPVEYERNQRATLLKQVAVLDDKFKQAQTALWVIAALLLFALFK